NLNSFRSVEKAVLYEVDRQIELLEKGERIIQETRGWDDAKQKTFSQRSKEDAHDYRYMPEPDVLPTELDQKFIDSIKMAMPLLADDLRGKLKSLELDAIAVNVLISSPEKALLVNQILETNGKDHAKRIANWVINTIDPDSEEQVSNNELDIDQAVKLSTMVVDNKVSSTA